MENKTLQLLEKQYKEIAKDIKAKKKEVKFDELIIDYKKIKKEVWKANNTLSKNDDDSKTKEFELSLKSAEARRDEFIKKFKEVEVFETKMYSVRKRAITTITSLDNRKNNNDYVVKSLENKNDELLKTIDPKTIDEFKKEITSNEKEIVELEKEVEALKLDNKPVKFTMHRISTLKSEIAKLNSEIKKCENANKVAISTRIENNNKIISDKKEVSDKLQKEIDFSVKLIENIDNELSFIDADEISENSSFTVKHLNVFYGQKQALFDINLDLPKNKVISIIGPSGCGKSTFLRTLNRINDHIPNFKAKGKILLDGEYDIFKLKSIRNRYDRIELSTLRTKVGMIFQQPNPFPMSIAKNVQYGPKVKGIKNKSALNELTEKSLIDAGIWDEVKDNLKALGTSLSGGQQQRLCIARAIANEPDILLMDEPTSALDPIAAKKIEDLILKLKKDYTIIMVTHSMQQAQRISDYTAFFYQGELIEYGKTKQVFETPKEKETKDYISGKFG